MKPKAPTEHEDGLLEYLEDIIGTAEMKKPIEDAAQKLEELQERVTRLNKLRITEGQKNALEEQKKAAEEHIRLKNELMRAHSLLLQFYLWEDFKQENRLKAAVVRVNLALGVTLMCGAYKALQEAGRDARGERGGARGTGGARAGVQRDQRGV